MATIKPFHERFALEVGLDQARQGFIARAHNRIFEGLFWEHREAWGSEILLAVADALGEHVNYERSLSRYVGEDSFVRTLRAIEAMYSVAAHCGWGNQLDSAIKYLLRRAEIDLGVRWDPPGFLPAGAKELDEKLVNDNLLWLRHEKYKSVPAPFEKGLRHLVQSEKSPELLSDVVTDMHEAVEALAKIRTGRDVDLSSNRELFIKSVDASDHYKLLLKDYIEYANRFRHAPRSEQARPRLSRKETESFVYLTGLFIRLAMPRAQAAVRRRGQIWKAYGRRRGRCA